MAEQSLSRWVGSLRLQKLSVFEQSLRARPTSPADKMRIQAVPTRLEAVKDKVTMLSVALATMGKSMKPFEMPLLLRAKRTIMSQGSEETKRTKNIKKLKKKKMAWSPF